ncbi:MAG: hypothetical protein V3U74_07965 [Thermodesulfobacteriota bacterium]
MILRSLFVIVAVVALSWGAANAQTGEIPDPVLSIKGVVKSPKAFDGRKIALEGKVDKVRFTESRKGKPYTLFRLTDPGKNRVRVYAKGHLSIKKGDFLKVYGRFKKEKRYFLFKFKNVLKAKAVQIISRRGRYRTELLSPAAVSPSGRNLL